MAKTLGKLRQQTAKLRELDVPSDVSKGTKNFVKKHVYVVHPDANENDDDVFKAANVKKAKRYPDHGYESGQDAAVYEGAYKDNDTDRKERAHDSVTMKKGRKRGESLKGDHRDSRRQEGQRLIDRQRTEETQLARRKSLNVESYEETEERNSDHHYLHTHILDALEGIHKTIGAHVNLMDNMNDKHHERSLNTLHKLHDSLLDFSERVSAIHMQARRTLGMHNETPPKPNHVTDVGGRAMLSPSIAGQTGPGKYAEGYEHIGELSEGDQSLLVDTYNSLSEDNQEKFLTLAETPEGVDKLLDFAITNSKGIK